MTDIKYTFDQFKDRFNNNEFTLDLKGHQFTEEYVWSSIKQKIEMGLRILEDRNDDIYSKCLIEIGKPLSILFSMVEFKCSHICGVRFYLGLTDENTISLFRTEGGYPSKDPLEFYNDDKCKCEYADGIPPQQATYDFKDELIFVNAFRNTEGKYLLKDAPEGKEYSDEFDLCCIKGCTGITKHKAETQNVAFGNMSNMSIAVYANKERTHFIITSPYLDDKVYDYEGEPTGIRAAKTIEFLKEGGYDDLGSICLGVWRYEASDLETLTKHGFDEETCIGEHHDIIKCKIPSGKWEMLHHFEGYNFGYNFVDPDNHSELEIYSEIRKKD